MGEGGYDHPYDILAGAIPGNWTSRVEYYSTEIGMGTFEKASEETFWVRQSLTIFKYE